MTDKKLTDKEIKEAKSLRWLAIQFPRVENPKDNGDRLCNCINLYCTNAAELIERLYAEIERLKGRINRLKDSYAESEERCYELARVYHQYEKVMKNDAYKEFAERLKEKHFLADNEDVDNLLKELVGEK